MIAGKKLLLNLYLWPMFVLLTLVSLLLLPILLGTNKLFLHQPRAKFLRKLIRIHGWVLVKIVPFMAPVTIEDKTGGYEPPVIFVSNHCSSVDPYLFGALPIENAFVTSWPFRMPVYNKLMRMAEYISSEDGWPVLCAQARKLFESGSSLIFWPEGHRAKDGRLQKFKKGAFLLAHETGRSIVPVCTLGTDVFLPPGKLFFTPSKIKIILLAPVSSPQQSSDDPVALLRNETWQKIAHELNKQKGALSDSFTN